MFSVWDSNKNSVWSHKNTDGHCFFVPSLPDRVWEGRENERVLKSPEGNDGDN